MPSQFGSRELLKYVKIKQPQILDLEQRTNSDRALRTIWKTFQKQRTESGRPQPKPSRKSQKSKKQGLSPVKWAKGFLAGNNAIRDKEDLKFDYFTHLNIQSLPQNLPSKNAIKDPKAFPAASTADSTKYKADLANCLKTLVAFRILGRSGNVRTSAKWLAFLERFPRLPTTPNESPYPPAIERNPQKARERKQDAKTTASGKSSTSADLQSLTTSIDDLWAIRSRMLQAKKNTLEDAYRQLTTPTARPTGRKAASRAGKQRPAPLLTPTSQSKFLKLKRDYQAAVSSRFSDFLTTKPGDLSKFSGGKSTKQISTLQQTTSKLLGQFNIKVDKFCAAYEQAATKADELPATSSSTEDNGCFAENPTVDFSDTVRLLGHADPVKVDETFLKYKPGEISYVENILPGEIRRRKVRNTKSFEEAVETTTEETKEASQETSVTTKQDLSSQIESELNARMNSDINTSAHGSGGGTIGVVDFEGGASAGANMALGVDSKFSSKSASDFSQEIVSKAIEKTKSSTVERRTHKTSMTFETFNSYEINNSSGTGSRNGIYCFLDKKVCITETIYGKRLFLLANVRLPGRNLICEKRQKLDLSLNDLGQKPVFDISVDDVTPATYKDLVARFKASNISPPPAPIQTISKTYKTDNTVNHGSNGISIPAHLPLKVYGAAAGTSVTLLTAAASGLLGPLALIPLGMWQFEYAVSPLAHYNSDSSNVSVCVGNETHDSPYYFFQPDFLLNQLFNVFGNLLASAPDLLESIQDKADDLIKQLTANAAQIPQDISAIITKTVNDVITNIQNILSSVSITESLKKGLSATFGALSQCIVDIQQLSKTMKGLFTPLQTFINDVITLFRSSIENGLADFLSLMSSIFDNSQVLPFFSPAGIRGELPVSINTVAINPGVTINLVACLQRTDEALDKWRLDTFDNLYDAYLKLAAEYDSKALMLNSRNGMTKSPGTLRQEELLALKELVLFSLNNLRGANGNKYDPETINFFENTIDWKNMTFRLFNYGPNSKEITLEKAGVFSGVDDRRIAFLKALWAQVLIPALPDPALEGKVTQFFADGTFNFEGGFSDDELAALYQELIQERKLIEESPVYASPPRIETIPTDLIILKDDLPTNPDTACSLTP